MRQALAQATLNAIAVLGTTTTTEGALATAVHGWGRTVEGVLESIIEHGEEAAVRTLSWNVLENAGHWADQASEHALKAYVEYGWSYREATKKIKLPNVEFEKKIPGLVRWRMAFTSVQRRERECRMLEELAIRSFDQAKSQEMTIAVRARVKCSEDGAEASWELEIAGAGTPQPRERSAIETKIAKRAREAGVGPPGADVKSWSARTLACRFSHKPSGSAKSEPE